MSEFPKSIDFPFEREIIRRDTSDEFVNHFESLIYSLRENIQNNANQTTNLWTPTVIGLTTDGVGTYTSQDGIYYKNKGLVYATGSIVWTAHTGTGTPAISGFPALFEDEAVAPIYVSSWTAPIPHYLIGVVDESYASLYREDELVSAITLEGASTAKFTMLYRVTE